MKKSVLSVLLTLILTTHSFGFFPQRFSLELNDERMQAMFVANFLRYIHWSDNSAPSHIINFLGSKSDYESFKNTIGERTINGKAVLVTQITMVSEIDKNAAIVYVSTAASGYFENVKTKIAGSSTLIVTESEGLGQKGSHINLVKVNGSYKFELNQKEIEGKNLKIASSLVAMAIVL